MTGYSPALAALAQKRAVELVERLVTAQPDLAAELVAGMSRDALIAWLLPPAERQRVERPYPQEAR